VKPALTETIARFRESVEAGDFEAARAALEGSPELAASPLRAVLAAPELSPAALEHTARGAMALYRDRLALPPLVAATAAVLALLLGALGRELGLAHAFAVGLAGAALAVLAGAWLWRRARFTGALMEALLGVVSLQMQPDPLGATTPRP
jgi:hypothetical protein